MKSIAGSPIAVSPQSLDPLQITDSRSAAYSSWLLYDELVSVGSDGKFLSGLAQTVNVSEDHLIYTFKLRTGVKFHDGFAYSRS